MRKFRYGNANGAAGWLKKTNIIYFIMAWNAFGLCAFQWWQGRKRSADPDWDKLTFAQKYMSFMTLPDDEVKVVRMSGFKVTSTKDTVMSEYLKPAPTPPRPDEKLETET